MYIMKLPNLCLSGPNFVDLPSNPSSSYVSFVKFNIKVPN